VRGASALQQLVDTIPQQKIRILVVWEPILWTDVKAPSGATLARVSDPRAAQFWDPDHAVADALREALSAADGPGIDRGRLSDEVLWDDIAIYAPGERWTDRMPAPRSFVGPVYDVIPEVREALEGVGAGTRKGEHDASGTSHARGILEGHVCGLS